jgi:hypothetical protein
VSVYRRANRGFSFGDGKAWKHTHLLGCVAFCAGCEGAHVARGHRIEGNAVVWLQIRRHARDFAPGQVNQSTASTPASNGDATLQRAIARVTAAGERPSRREAPARLFSSAAAMKAVNASIRSITGFFAFEKAQSSAITTPAPQPSPAR